MMISASTARQQTQQMVEKNLAELKDLMMKAIQLAINQGSTKTSFYPRNVAERTLAMVVLNEHGYRTQLQEARDQRDRDTIQISWD